MEEIEYYYKDLANIYSVDVDDVEEVVYDVLREYFNTDNVLLDEEGLFVNGIHQTYFTTKHLKAFREMIEEKLNILSIDRYKILLKQLTKSGKIEGIFEDFDDEYYYFGIELNNQILKTGKLLVPRKNVYLTQEKIGNRYTIYTSGEMKKIKFNVLGVFGAIITKKSIMDYFYKYIYPKLEKIYPIQKDDIKVKNYLPLRYFKYNFQYGIIFFKSKIALTDVAINMIENFYLTNFGYKVKFQKKKS